MSRANPEEAILELLIDAYLRASPLRQRDDRPYRPGRIVRKAEERFLASLEKNVSLADLCAATGVGKSTLYRAFDIVCSVPPLTYFPKRRLTDACRALIRSPAYSGAIKSVALGVGLTEVVRFSVQYRNLFGESPAATPSRDIPL